MGFKPLGHEAVVASKCVIPMGYEILWSLITSSTGCFLLIGTVL